MCYVISDIDKLDKLLTFLRNLNYTKLEDRTVLIFQQIQKSNYFYRMEVVSKRKEISIVDLWMSRTHSVILVQ